jgi:hypothetical protein
MASMRREAPARQAVLPTAPFQPEGLDTACRTGQSLDAYALRQLDYLARGIGGIERAALAIGAVPAPADFGTARSAVAAYVAGIIHRWDLRRPSLPGPGCPMEVISCVVCNLSALRCRPGRHLQSAGRSRTTFSGHNMAWTLILAHGRYRNDQGSDRYFVREDDFGGGAC